MKTFSANRNGPAESGKAESRKPKAEGSSKSETRIGNRTAGVIRISRFGFPSDFGFRISGFRLALPALLALLVLPTLTGCFGFLKPAHGTARHFILTSLPVTTNAPASSGAPLAVGVGYVKLPAYLFNTSIAVRSNANEIAYLDSALWAERVDLGLQRVIAANLATLLPTDLIRLSSWSPEDVAVEVYVAVERFDVTAAGQAALVARWRVLSPGGKQTLHTGECRLTRAGPMPATDPAGAVSSLSELAAELSRQLVEAIKRTPARGD